MAKRHAIIIGAGLGGLTAAIKLQEDGHSFDLIDRNPKVGGTWYENSYPGCACDVPVALYQLSFAQSINWTRTFPQGPEIQAYAEEITERYQLAPHLHLGDYSQVCGAMPTVMTALIYERLEFGRKAQTRIYAWSVKARTMPSVETVEEV